MQDHDPYDDRWQRGWRKLERMAERWGRGAPFGPRGWESFGENFRVGRMLASGDVRLVALFLIEEQPRHGYDLIKAIEERSHGFYSPSPGIVYPALTFLEEAGYVSSAPDGNKKLYTITDEGRAHLNDNRDAVRSTLDFLGKAGEQVNKWRDMAREGWQPGDEQSEHHEHRGPGPGWGGPRRHGPHRHGPEHRPDRDTPNVVPEFNEARRELKAAIADAIAGNEDEQRRVADILRRAAADIRRGAPETDVDL